MSYGSGEPFTVGIEEELLLVDPVTLAPAPVAGEVLDGLDLGGRAGHEVYAASVELRSSPARTVEAAVSEIGGLRRAVGRSGGTLAGVGVHPDGAFGDAPLVDDPRYRRVDGEMRGLVRRTPECALHIHVGMPDEQTAIRVFNGLRERLPLLQGLAANSPWWFGVDSGLASARAALVRAYPGRGIPRALRDADDWAELVEVSLAAGDLPDYTFLWWDIRLHPRHGTVEVRELDAQSSLDDVAAIAALVRALAVEAASATRIVPQPSEPLAWSAFRASRDGVGASVLEAGVHRPLANVARAAAERLRPTARALGDEDALDLVRRILACGGGAGRRRQAFARRALRGQLEEIVEETAPGPRLPAARAEPAGGRLAS